MNKKLISTVATVVLALNLPISVLAAPKQMPDGGIFDPEYYIETYPDVASVLGTDENVLYEHYKNYGQVEGRLPFSINENMVVFNALNQAMTSNGTISFDAAYKELKKSQQYAAIICINKTTTPKDIRNYIWYNYVNFSFNITNNSTKDIKGIEGNLTIYDLFGKEIMNANCDFTGNTIKVGETYTDNSMVLQCNEFLEHHMKLYNSNYSDLIFDYKIKSIVYTDGTVVQPE